MRSYLGLVLMVISCGGSGTGASNGVGGAPGDEGALVGTPGRRTGGIGSQPDAGATGDTASTVMDGPSSPMVPDAGASIDMLAGFGADVVTAAEAGFGVDVRTVDGPLAGSDGAFDASLDGGVYAVCGKPGTPCCAGGVCVSGCCGGFVGNARICVAGGAMCALGGVCNAATGGCGSCGAPGDRCCPGDTCTAAFVLCDQRGVTVCVACGAVGESCCLGNEMRLNVCKTGATCGKVLVCQ